MSKLRVCAVMILFFIGVNLVAPATINPNDEQKVETSTTAKSETTFSLSTSTTLTTTITTAATTEIVEEVTTVTKVEESNIPEVHYTQETFGKESQTNEQEILAKLLYREAGGMGWEGQVYVCSAILNLRDRNNCSIWTMAHDINTFAVAPYVDSAVPTATQYEVIEYVLNGGRIKEICYFREDYYHSFGTPVCQIENICFSKP